MKIHVNYIAETWHPVWAFPTPFNRVFSKTQVLWWTKDEEDYGKTYHDEEETWQRDEDYSV